jgi:hypothetical protein
MRPKPCLNVTIQDVGNELLVLDRSSNQLHHLNPTASWIYRRCDGNRSVEVIIDDLIDHFSVEKDVAQRDLIEMLSQLRTLGLISTDE